MSRSGSSSESPSGFGSLSRNSSTNSITAFRTAAAAAATSTSTSNMNSAAASSTSRPALGSPLSPLAETQAPAASSSSAALFRRESSTSSLPALRVSHNPLSPTMARHSVTASAENSGDLSGQKLGGQIVSRSIVLASEADEEYESELIGIVHDRSDRDLNDFRNRQSMPDFASWRNCYNAAEVSGGEPIDSKFAHFASTCGTHAILNVFLIIGCVVTSIILFEIGAGEEHKYRIPIIVLLSVGGAVGVFISLINWYLLRRADEITAQALGRNIRTVTRSQLDPNNTDVWTRKLALTGMPNTDARIAWIGDIWMKAVPFLETTVLEYVMTSCPLDLVKAGDNKDGVDMQLGSLVEERDAGGGGRGDDAGSGALSDLGPSGEGSMNVDGSTSGGRGASASHGSTPQNVVGPGVFGLSGGDVEAAEDSDLSSITEDETTATFDNDGLSGESSRRDSSILNNFQSMGMPQGSAGGAAAPSPLAPSAAAGGGGGGASGTSPQCVPLIHLERTATAMPGQLSQSQLQQQGSASLSIATGGDASPTPNSGFASPAQGGGHKSGSGSPIHQQQHQQQQGGGGSGKKSGHAAFSRVVKAFMSKLPFTNTTNYRTVVVVHFSFYFNRHGPQRPPPFNSCPDTIREFVTTACQVVNSRSGSVYSIQPNIVVAFWEVGLGGQSSMTCEANACIAAKEFAKAMKTYKQKALAYARTQQLQAQQQQQGSQSRGGGGGGGQQTEPAAKSSNLLTADLVSPSFASAADVFAGASVAAAAVSSGGGGTSSNRSPSSQQPQQQSEGSLSESILARSIFTCGVAKGLAMRGSLGTQTKQSAVLFGPVVLKAAMLAQVGVKIHASVVITQSLYFSNNMSFVMRPVEDILVPKWLSEMKIAGRGGGGGGDARGATGGGLSSMGMSTGISPFRVHATPVSTDLPSSSAAGATTTDSKTQNSSANIGTLTVDDIGGGKQQQPPSSQQRPPIPPGHDVETVYQLLSTGDAGGKDSQGGGGGGGDNVLSSANKDNEWMYHLEKHGGAELHVMSQAFDCFRAGNLSQAASLYETVFAKSKNQNYADRFVVAKIRCLSENPDAATGASPGGGNNAAVAAAAAAAAAATAAAISNTLSNDSMATYSGHFVDDPASGGEGSGSGSGAGSGPCGSSTVLNMRRLAVQDFFDELKSSGQRYARRVAVTGVDDFSFE